MRKPIRCIPHNYFALVTTGARIAPRALASYVVWEAVGKGCFMTLELANQIALIALCIASVGMLVQAILVYLTVRQMRRLELLRDLSSNLTVTGSDASGCMNSAAPGSTIFRSE
ncbi:MAG: hypothetical protein AB7E60_02880 [Sphingobium sp.]